MFLFLSNAVASQRSTTLGAEKKSGVPYILNTLLRTCRGPFGLAQLLDSGS